MMGYWGQFARSGAPGRGTRSAGPEWLPWETGGRFMVFDTGEGGGVRVEKGEATRTRASRRRRRSAGCCGTCSAPSAA